MDKFVTAVFASPDEAAHARSRMLERGVRICECSIEPLRAERRGDDLTLVANPFTPIFSNNLAENWGAFAGANMGKYGGFLYLHTPSDGELNACGVLRRDPTRETGGEVLMRLRLDGRDLAEAEGVLVSCHASRLRKS